jgi:Uma2 family endonuclease
MANQSVAAVSRTPTVAEFEAQYAREKPYYEFWYGEAIQKSLPTSTHGLVQGILINLLRETGYRAASEVELRIDLDFHPIPDVIASMTRLETPYPTKAIEVVIEIVSSDDPMSWILAKCRAYQAWGFQQIYVVDPSARLVIRWLEHQLEEVDFIANHPALRVWSELDKESA